MAEQVKS